MDEIVKLYLERNERAIEETEKRYGKLCVSLACNILGSSADAEEAVNDTYLALWNAIPPEQPDNMTAFVAKITRNIALKRVRYNSAEKRAAVPVSLSELEEVIPDKTQWETGELTRLINAFLYKESAVSRNVFIRRYWFSESIEEIARRYSFSESKVKSILHRSRNKLKKYLQKEGISL